MLIVLQVGVAMGLLNVWLVRCRKSTEYRGKSADCLSEEFKAYGLPIWMMYVVGALKIGVAIAFLVGIWVPGLVFPAALVLIVLMLGALAMHVKVKDEAKKSLPAAGMLLLAVVIAFLSS